MGLGASHGLAEPQRGTSGRGFTARLEPELILTEFHTHAYADGDAHADAQFDIAVSTPVPDGVLMLEKGH